MSFSAVNMCRLVIAVFVISFLSCVLAENGPDPKKPQNSCAQIPEIKTTKAGVMTCFNYTVGVHLNASASIPGECQNVADFDMKLNQYLQKVKTICNVTLGNYNTSHLIKFIEFSLQNDSFKKFYDGVSCLKKKEYDISNTCVKGKAGFFNITTEKKHTTWYRKATLRYNSLTCRASKNVKECVETELKTCDNSTSAYVASLFTFARELANCAQIEKNVPTPPPPNGTNGAVPLTASWLSVPAIIIITYYIKLY